MPLDPDIRRQLAKQGRLWLLALICATAGIGHGLADQQPAGRCLGVLGRGRPVRDRLVGLRTPSQMNR